MVAPATDPDEIAAIYDELIDTYQAEWEKQGHRSLHLEYFDDDHTEPGPAAINTMRQLAERVEISASDRVLNIGCGVGEDSVWNARAYGATVIGINISEQQLELARENAAGHEVTDQTEFRYDDFHTLETVDDNSIDVVWGLEALSHAHDRAAVVDQLVRVLVPGGRLVLSDLFFHEAAEMDGHQEDIERINEGLGLKLGAIDSFRTTLETAGFQAIETSNETEPIRPSLDRRHKFARIAHPVGRLFSFANVFSETQLGVFKGNSLIRKLVEEGVLGYYFVTATLPDTE